MSQTGFYFQKCGNFHSKEISNFCTSEKCFQTLCPECIEQHSELHRKNQTLPQIQSIANTRLNCINKVNVAIKQIQSQIDKMNNEFTFNAESDKQLNLDKIQLVKQDLINHVELYFDNLKTQIENQTKENILKMKNIQQKLSEFYVMQEYLQNLSAQIENTQSEQLFQSLEKVIRLDAKKLIDKYQSDMVKIMNSKIIEKIDIHYVDEKLFAIKQFLEKLIYLRKAKYYSFNNDKSSTNSHNSEAQYIGSKSLDISQHLSQENHLRVQTLPELGNFSNQSYRSDQQISIDQSSFLLSNVKFLQFFVSEQKLLKIFNIDSLKWQSIKLNFIVPQFHSSVITPDRFIYLIGGILQQQAESSILQYTGDQKLIVKAKLSTERYLHRAVYCKDSIYIIGGYTGQNKLTKLVEKYHLKNQQVTRCADCLETSIFPTCCAYNNKYIYKFSIILNNQMKQDFIERYDIENNRWQNLQFKINPNELQKYNGLNYCSSAVQINPNSIFVFGGYKQFPYDENNNNNFSQNSFLLTINENKHQINSIYQYPLPKADGFFDPQVVVHDKKLFVLQNMENPSFGVEHDNRIPLCFESGQWRILQ